ncbi:hypothetical protein, partial [Acidithiobacillus sp.]|uniref:hypothetical protein n=1 Tax=Acidithiobacillus sp. TaxID=1872118 RepID=UPI003D01C559
FVSAMLFSGNANGSHVNGFVEDELNPVPNAHPSVAMQKFISTSPIPLAADAQSILADAALTPSQKEMALHLLATEAEPYIVDAYASEFGTAIYNAAALIFNDDSRLTPPKNYAQTLYHLQMAIQHYNSQLVGVAQENDMIMGQIEAIERSAAVKAVG